MPEVGYDREPVRKELRTAPPDGYVLLRRLPYDEILKRREMAMRLSMEQTGGKRGKRNKDEKSLIGIELAQIVTREFEFKNCIADHNLTVNGQPVDFSNPKLAFKHVSPEILQEIELYLSELNQETDEDELDDFLSAARHSSSEEGILHEITTESS